MFAHLGASESMSLTASGSLDKGARVFERRRRLPTGARSPAAMQYV